MLHPHPGADQSIEAVFQRLKCSKCGDLLRLRQRKGNRPDVLIQGGSDLPELHQKPADPLGNRQLLSLPVQKRAADLVGNPVVALQQRQQGDMGIDLDNTRTPRAI